MDPFIGEIRAFGFGQIPKGWALCDGSLLSIQQNAALFSLLGTYYGGNGSSNFALPDLRGRGPLGQGIGPDGQPYNIGLAGGKRMVDRSSAQLVALNDPHSPMAESFRALRTGVKELLRRCSLPACTP